MLLISGTTGPPRAVQRRPSAAILPTLAALLNSLALRAGAPTLLTLPLYHGHGLSTLAICLALAAPLHLPKSTRPGDHWQRLEAEQIEVLVLVLVLVPTMLYRLLAQHGPLADRRALADPALADPALADPALADPVLAGTVLALTTIVCGSAPLTARLVRQAQEVSGEVLHNLYGSSEAGLISHATPQMLWEAPGSVGKVLPGVRLRLDLLRNLALLRNLDLLGQAARDDPGAVGQVGTIIIEHGSGHIDTADLGQFGTEGHLYLRGRQNDLLIIGGENVSAEMIEERVCALSAVRECAVPPVPCKEYGQAVQMWVVLSSGYSLSASEVQRELEALLPRMFRPLRLSIVDALPRTPLGKLQRHKLRRRALQDPTS